MEGLMLEMTEEDVGHPSPSKLDPHHYSLETTRA
jgi:hypothetical protein